jgi:hypothetical protein
VDSTIKLWIQQSFWNSSVAEPEIPEYSFSDVATEVNDSCLVARLAQSYRNADREFAGHGTSFWAGFQNKHGEFKVACESGDLFKLGNLLRDS